MKRITVCFGVIAPVLLLATSFARIGYSQSNPAQAAAPPAPLVLKVSEIKVNPGMEYDFAGFVKANVLPALTKLGVKDFGVWKIDQFGDTNTYFFLTPIQSLAELDKPLPWVQVVGQEALGTLFAMFQRLVAGTRDSLIQAKPGLTIPVKPGYAYKIGVLATNTVAPGREAEYEAASKAFMGVIGKTNAKGFLTFKLGLGGDPNEYTTLVPFDSFADLSQFEPAFMKALGAAKLAPETAGIVVHRKYEIVRFIPELSIEPKAKLAAK
jgi:hypothetical protein